MRNIKKRIIMYIVETLVFSIVITLLFSTNMHRVYNIRDNVGGYIRETQLSQDIVFFENIYNRLGEKCLRTVQLEEGTVVCFDNSSGSSIFGTYVDYSGCKHEIQAELSQIDMLPEIQLYLSELNEINRDRKNEFVRLTMIHDYPISIIVSLVMSMVIAIIAKDKEKCHVICVIAGTAIIFVFFVIARNISVPI